MTKSKHLDRMIQRNSISLVALSLVAWSCGRSRVDLAKETSQENSICSLPLESLSLKRRNDDIIDRNPVREMKVDVLNQDSVFWMNATTKANVLLSVCPEGVEGRLESVTFFRPKYRC